MKKMVVFFALSFYSLSLIGIACGPNILNEVEGSPFALGSNFVRSAIKFHSTGRFTATVGGPDAVFISTVGLTGTVVKTITVSLGTGGAFQPIDLAFSPDGTVLVVVGADSSDIFSFLVSIDGTLTLVGNFSTSPFLGQSKVVSFDPNGTFIVVARDGGLGQLVTLNVSSTGIVTPISEVITNELIGDIALSPDGSLLAVANELNNSVSMFRVASNGTLTEIGETPLTSGIRPFSIAFHPKGNLLATANLASNNVTLFAVSPSGTLTELTPDLSVETNPRTVSFNPLGNYLAVGNGGSSNLSLFEISEDQEFTEAVGSPFSVNTPLQLDFSPGNNFLALTSDGNTSFANSITMFCIKRNLIGCTKALVDKYQPICPIQ